MNTLVHHSQSEAAEIRVTTSQHTTGGITFTIYKATYTRPDGSCVVVEAPSEWAAIEALHMWTAVETKEALPQ